MCLRVFASDAHAHATTLAYSYYFAGQNIALCGKNTHLAHHLATLRWRLEIQAEAACSSSLTALAGGPGNFCSRRTQISLSVLGLRNLLLQLIAFTINTD